MSRIALQLYTVRDLCAEDLAGALASTAALGFEGVELHDLYGHPADAVRRLLDETGLVACFLELDLGWVWYAGSDPFALLDRAGEQAPLVHVKDMKKDGGPVHVPLGAGDVDYGRLMDTAGRAGVEWLILEQDETHGRGFEAVEASIAELTRLSGSTGAS